MYYNNWWRNHTAMFPSLYKATTTNSVALLNYNSVLNAPQNYNDTMLDMHLPSTSQQYSLNNSIVNNNLPSTSQQYSSVLPTFLSSNQNYSSPYIGCGTYITTTNPTSTSTSMPVQLSSPTVQSKFYPDLVTYPSYYSPELPVKHTDYVTPPQSININNFNSFGYLWPSNSKIAMQIPKALNEIQQYYIFYKSKIKSSSSGCDPLQSLKHVNKSKRINLFPYCKFCVVDERYKLSSRMKIRKQKQLLNKLGPLAPNEITNSIKRYILKFNDDSKMNDILDPNQLRNTSNCTQSMLENAITNNTEKIIRHLAELVCFGELNEIYLKVMLDKIYVSSRPRYRRMPYTNNFQN